MTDEAVKLMVKGSRALRAAETLIRAHDAESAIGRAYYAMFHGAQALLRMRNLRFRKHAGVHAAFGEQFIKTGVLDAKLHRWLLAAFSERQRTEYGLDTTVDEETATMWVNRACEFLAEAERHLESQGKRQ